LLEVKKHKAWKLLRQIPGIGPIRAAVLMAVMQTPHRFRTKRQLWNYCGLGLETHDTPSARCARFKTVGLSRRQPPASRVHDFDLH